MVRINKYHICKVYTEIVSDTSELTSDFIPRIPDDFSVSGDDIDRRMVFGPYCYICFVRIF